LDGVRFSVGGADDADHNGAPLQHAQSQGLTRRLTRRLLEKDLGRAWPGHSVGRPVTDDGRSGSLKIAAGVEVGGLHEALGRKIGP
jgi:hypothetical protein